jgi:transcriptional regulator with XRE-family HTH domain
MLKTAREKRGLTQSELAEKVGVHLVTICRIETGARNPSMPLLQKIAKALGMRLVVGLK